MDNFGIVQDLGIYYVKFRRKIYLAFFLHEIFSSEEEM